MQLVCAKKTGERTYEFYIGGEIGHEVNGTYIEGDMAFINKNKLADRIDFHINSEGGSVINGVRIVSAIYKSEIPIHTFNDGFAMSMGGFIWLSAPYENRHMVNFGSLMLHAPRFVSEDGEIVEPESEDDKKMLQVVTDMLSQITKNNTGLSKAEIADILSKDTFYNAKEAVEAGFMKKENIIRYNNVPKLDGTTAERIQRIAAFYKDNNLEIQNSQKMKQIAAKLKLNAEASETAILEKIDAIVAEKDSAMADLKELQDENNKNVQAITDSEKRIKELETTVSDYEEKEKKAKDELAASEVAAAIKEGFFKDDEETKKEITAIAVKDIEGFRTLKKSVIRKVEAPDITVQLTGTGEELTQLAAKHGIKVENFNYDYLWRNNQAVLDALKVDNPKIHAAMLAQWEKSEAQ